MAEMKSRLTMELNDRVSGRAGRMIKDIRNLDKAARSAEQATRTIGAIGPHAAAAGRGAMAIGKMAAGLTAVAAAAATYKASRAVIDAASDYNHLEANIAEVAVTAGITTDAMKEMLRTSGANFAPLGKTADDAVEAVKVLISNGLEAKDAVDLAPMMLKTAKATRSMEADVAGMASSMRDNLKVPVSEMQRTMDGLVMTSKDGAVEIKNMARDFPKVTASASKVGFAGRDGALKLGAMLQVVKKSAPDAATAANYLSNFMDKINSPETLKKFKKQFGTDMPRVVKEGAKKGLSAVEAIAEFLNKKKFSPEKLGFIWEDTEARNAISALMAFYAEYKEILDKARKANGTVEADLKQVGETGESALKRIEAQWDRLQKKLGQRTMESASPMLGPIEKVTKDAADIFEAYDVFDKEYRRLTGRSPTMNETFEAASHVDRAALPASIEEQTAFARNEAALAAARKLAPEYAALKDVARLDVLRRGGSDRIMVATKPVPALQAPGGTGAGADFTMGAVPRFAPIMTYRTTSGFARGRRMQADTQVNRFRDTTPVTPAGREAAPMRAPSAAGTLGGLEQKLSRFDVSGLVDATTTMSSAARLMAEAAQSLMSPGHIKADLEGRLDASITVRVDGPGHVSKTGIQTTGPLNAIGVSMPHIPRNIHGSGR